MNDLSDELTKLTKAVEESNRQKSLWRSFMHGILVGLGSTIGAIVAISIMVYLLRSLIVLPYFGPFSTLLPKLEQALEQATGNGQANIPAVVPGTAPESITTEGTDGSASETR